MSSGADVVTPGTGVPQQDQPDARPGLWQRTVDNVKSGNLGVLPVLLGEVAIVTFFALTASNFFTSSNFVNIIVQMAGVTLMAYGVVFVLLLGEIDLSIGYLSGIAALVVAELQLSGSSHNYPGIIAIVIAILVTGAIGAGQGAIVAKVGVPSFVVTLAGLLIFQGVILHALELRGGIIIEDKLINDLADYFLSPTAGWITAVIITGAYAVSAGGGVLGRHRAGVAKDAQGLVLAKVAGVAVAVFGSVWICNNAERPNGSAVGVPLAGLLMIVFLVGLTYLAKRTSFGRHVYAVGGNAEAARRAGINVNRIRILVFMISGIMAGVAGIVLAARLNSVNLDVGGGTLLLDAIAAAVIGGTSLFGGRGEVRSALVGSLVIATIANGMSTAGYSNGTIYIVTGVILLLAVTLDTVARRLQVKSGR